MRSWKRKCARTFDATMHAASADMQMMNSSLLLHAPINWHAADHEGHEHDARGRCGGYFYGAPVTLGTPWWGTWDRRAWDQGTEGESVGYGVVSPLMLHGARPHEFSQDDVERIYRESHEQDGAMTLDGGAMGRMTFDFQSGDVIGVNGKPYEVIVVSSDGAKLTLRRLNP